MTSASSKERCLCSTLSRNELCSAKKPPSLDDLENCSFSPFHPHLYPLPSRERKFLVHPEWKFRSCPNSRYGDTEIFSSPP